MEKARLAVFEDSYNIREMLRIASEMAGHVVVAEAVTVDEALHIVSTNDFEIAIIDGNLNPGKIDCSDGKTILAEIRQRRPQATVVWFSNVPSETVSVDCDIDIGKDVFGVMEAIEAL